MKKYINLMLFFVFALFVIACAKDETAGNPEQPDPGNGGDPPIDPNQNNGWLIPQNEVLDGGPGKDGIPALTNPEFVEASAVDYLSNDDLVLGYFDGNEARAYPHSILDYHEIVNDDFDELSIAVIYCPLTGTGIGWDRKLGETKTTFGVSGLLYNSNIIPYDRLSDSYWSQIQLRGVRGTYADTIAKTYNLLETTWKNWKEMYPNTSVVSTNTGHSRNYNVYPYGSYRTSNQLIFPVSHHDGRLHRKQRVLGVLISGKAIAYDFERFSAGGQNSNVILVNDFFNGKDVVVATNEAKDFAVAFDKDLDGTTLEFSPTSEPLPAVMQDNEGTVWDVFGRGLSGPRQGEQLSTFTQFIGYWFAWAAFYPDIELYQ